jgi:Fe-S-cluster containining protein
MQRGSLGEKRVAGEASSPQSRAGCIRCGTCCQKGGPALHKEDKKLLQGHISRENLITLRKGELAFSPLTGKLEPLKQELVKIAGKGKKWVCCYYNEAASSCTLYSHRPLECRLLKCWDTSELLAHIGKDTLTRADIVAPDDPVMQHIETHERQCSLPVVEELLSVLQERKGEPGACAGLAALIHQDLSIRSQAISEFSLSLEAELFFFGRPLFKILSARGFPPGD